MPPSHPGEQPLVLPFASSLAFGSGLGFLAVQFHDVDGRRGSAVSSLVSGGCIVSGASLRRSLLFTGVHLHSYAQVEGAVILPYADIGQRARLRNVIVEREVRIPPGLTVGFDPELDESRFRRTANGVCLITRRMIERLEE